VRFRLGGVSSLDSAWLRSFSWIDGRAFSMSRSLMSIPFFLHQGLCFCCCSLRCTLLSTGFLFAGDLAKSHRAVLTIGRLIFHQTPEIAYLRNRMVLLCGHSLRDTS
jgi:hypothetical protein